jgi:hypothetical protein
MQIIKLLLVQFSPVFCHLISLRSRCFSQHPVLKRLSLCSLHDKQVSQLYKTPVKLQFSVF